MNETLLIRGRWIVRDVESEILDDAAILVEQGLVSEIGDWKRMRRANPESRVLGDERSAVIPGLVNAHHHSHAVSSILHGVSDELLEPWILSWHALRSVDPGLNTLVSAGIQLGAGVTTVVDLLSSGGTAEQFADTVDQALRAYDRAGLRVAFAPGVSTQSHLVAGAGEDARFIASLPNDLRRGAELLLPGPDRLGEDDYFSVMQELHRVYASHPRVDLWYGPPGPQWVSDDCLQRVAEAAQRWDCGIQTHVNESFYEKLHGQRFYREPTVLHLDRLGVLGPRFSIAHGTWLNRDEIEAMARSGAAVSHNPSSNLRLRAGIAPLTAYLKSGVTTALGMDATTLNENDDMFAELRLAMRLQCHPFIEQDTPSVADVFSAATVGGAKLLGKDRQIGRLAPGYAADLVILDTERMLWPWVAPEADPLELITLRAQREDIRQVLVAGEVLWSDGAATRFDLNEAASELADQLSAASFPQAKSEAVQAIKPRLKNWYAQWEKPDLDPWTIYGSQV